MINLIFSFIFIISIIVGNAAASIFFGIIFAFFFKPSENFFSRRVGTIPLQIGIVLLGATISFPFALKVTSDLMPWISFFVISSFLMGLFLGRVLRINKSLVYLISSGAAICGATAMAAIAPIIKAKPQELLIAMSIIFLLNTIAIFLFPIVGDYLKMTNFEFGAWSALAIHDTSSVVGSALIYSNESAQVAATLKLGRTIWLIPLILITNWIFNKEIEVTKFPRFILFFIIAILTNAFLNPDEAILDILKITSKGFLIFGLLCIGSQFNFKELKTINSKPLILALALWVVVIPSSYILVKYF